LTTKYGNKFVFYDKSNDESFEHRPEGALPNSIIRFDSKLEFAVFEVLNAYIPGDQIKLQVPIELKPLTQYSASVSYFVDFQVLDCNFEPDFYVEAKGFLTKEASLKLKMLEIIKPKIRHSLMIVSSQSCHYFGKKYPLSTSLVELRLFLGNKYGRRIR
jgi:hypothetical protein